MRGLISKHFGHVQPDPMGWPVTLPMTLMDFVQIRKMLELMREHGLVEFELEQDGERIRLRFAEAAVAGHAPAVLSGDVLREVVTVEAPMLGTCYVAGEPDAEPFVQLGDRVSTGDVLCIIEAMKLMNEIRSTCDGEVVDLFVENGQVVQYGDRLFAIRPPDEA